MKTRRDFCVGLPVLALLAEARGVLGQAGHGTESAEVSKPAVEGTALLRRNEVFRSSVLPVHESGTGSSQAVVRGDLVTGEGVELHNTVLLPGQAPHPPHQHVHAEFLLVREGTVEWLVEGARQTAGPGDILYAASQVMHGIRNVGAVPAKYFVVAIGPNLKVSA